MKYVYISSKLKDSMEISTKLCAIVIAVASLALDSITNSH